MGASEVSRPLFFLLHFFLEGGFLWCSRMFTWVSVSFSGALHLGCSLVLSGGFLVFFKDFLGLFSRFTSPRHPVHP